MMCRLLVAAWLFLTAFVLTESRLQRVHHHFQPHPPYNTLSSWPRGRAAIKDFINEAEEHEDITHTPFVHDNDQAFIVVDNDNTEAEEEYNDLEAVKKMLKPTKIMVPSDITGALLVPDGIIEVEGETMVDAQTGQTTLMVPRQALDAIPNGSIVAVLEQPLDDEETPEERANRVLVRRQKKGSRLNVRRGGNRRRGNAKRGLRNKQRRPQNVKRYRPQVQVINLSNNNRRRGYRRPSNSMRPIVLQG